MAVKVQFFGAPPVTTKPAVFSHVFSNQTNFRANFAIVLGGNNQQTGQMVYNNVSVQFGAFLHLERVTNITGAGAIVDCSLVPVSLTKTSWWNQLRPQFSEVKVTSWTTAAGQAPHTFGVLCLNSSNWAQNIRPYGYLLDILLHDVADGGPQYRLVYQSFTGLGDIVGAATPIPGGAAPGDVFRLEVTPIDATNALVEAKKNGVAFVSQVVTAGNLPQVGLPCLYVSTVNSAASGSLVNLGSYSGGPL